MAFRLPFWIFSLTNVQAIAFISSPSFHTIA
jgi:hypothetical protein